MSAQPGPRDDRGSRTEADAAAHETYWGSGWDDAGPRLHEVLDDDHYADQLYHQPDLPDEPPQPKPAGRCGHVQDGGTYVCGRRAGHPDGHVYVAGSGIPRTGRED